MHVRIVGYSSEDEPIMKIKGFSPIVSQRPMYHKYIFPQGEVRTYANKLKYIGGEVKYAGTTTAYIDHWKVYEPIKYAPSPKKVKKGIVKNVSTKIPQPNIENVKPLSQLAKETLKSNTDEYFVYLVRGEKQYYKIYKEWDEDVVKQYDIKYLGIASLPDKVYWDTKNGTVKKSTTTTTKVKRTKIPEISRPDNKHCCYCAVLLTSKYEPSPTAMTIEHIVPLGRGGTNDKRNLKNACYQCNHEKGDLLLHSYIQMLNLKFAETKTGSPEYNKLQTKIINANEIAKSLKK